MKNFPKTQGKFLPYMLIFSSCLMVTVILLASLLIISVFFLKVNNVNWMSILQVPPTPSQAPTRYIIYNPTIIPSSTVTPSITHTNTITPTASNTPSPTPIPISAPPATLTPVQVIQKRAYYNLANWSVEQTNNNIALLENFPGSLTLDEASFEEYYESFLPAALAANEAILLFPQEDHQVWQMSLALNLARSGNPLASAKYAEMINSLLNQKSISITDLATWFQSRQTELSFNTYPISPLEGYDSAYLFHIADKGCGLIWILKKGSKYTTIPLISVFNFSKPMESHITLQDITHDGTPEVISYFIPYGHSDLLHLPIVLDISSNPAKTLPFKHTTEINMGLPYNGEWKITYLENQKTILVFKGVLFPTCPLEMTTTFQWTGTYFELQENAYKVFPAKDAPGFCALLLDHARANWGVNAAKQITEQLLPFWPPPPLPGGETFPLDAKDELLFQLGLYHALEDNSKKAKESLIPLSSTIVNIPNRWVEAAISFLEAYKEPQDIYRACSAINTADVYYSYRINPTYLGGFFKFPISQQAKYTDYEQFTNWSEYSAHYYPNIQIPENQKLRKIFHKDVGRYFIANNADFSSLNREWQHSASFDYYVQKNYEQALEQRIPIQKYPIYAAQSQKQQQSYGFLCNPRYALSSLFDLYPAESPNNRNALLTYLTKNGVSIRASGYFDFDGDDETEQWYIISPHRNLRLEFWLYSAKTNQFMFVNTINTNYQKFELFQPTQNPPIITIEDNFTFRVNTYLSEKVASVEIFDTNYFWYGYAKNNFNTIIYNFLTQSDLSPSSTLFTDLSSHPDFLCSREQKECAEFYTLRALAYQRYSQPESALYDYYTAYTNYPSSAFYYLARIKLDPIPLTPNTPQPISTFTPTPNLSITPTPSSTLTVTITGTPTVTETITVTPSETPT